MEDGLKYKFLLKHCGNLSIYYFFLNLVSVRTIGPFISLEVQFWCEIRNISRFLDWMIWTSCILSFDSRDCQRLTTLYSGLSKRMILVLNVACFTIRNWVAPQFLQMPHNFYNFLDSIEMPHNFWLWTSGYLNFSIISDLKKFCWMVSSQIVNRKVECWCWVRPVGRKFWGKQFSALA